MDISLVLHWSVLALSFYVTISLLWLGVMVLLVGNRASPGVWLTASGLLAGALFFTCHTAILGRGLNETGFGMNFWWTVSWIPAAVAPLAWYAAMLWHTGFHFERGHPHRFWLLVAGGLLVTVLFLLIFANPLPDYRYVTGLVLVLTPSIGGIPLLVVAYLAYSLLCYLLPLDLLRRPGPSENPLLERPRRLARPWLAAATLAMLLAGGVLSWTALWALTASYTPGLADPSISQIVKEFDLGVELLVALAVTLLGRAVVAYEVFTGRPLPRDRFFYQWRSATILAGGFGGVAAWTLAIELRPVYSLMLATALMAIFYALIAWRSYSERENFLARLRPFVASQNLYGQLTRPALAAGDRGASLLFESLCREILGARVGVLVPAGPLATLAGPPLVYALRPGERPAPPVLSEWAGRFHPATRCLPLDGGSLAWAVPLWSDQGLGGVLFIGPKETGNPFTEEEIDLAQAGGERLLDMLAGSEVARLSLELLRQRVVQARVLEGQGRRVLHDEVLPELHTSVLYLNSLSAANPQVKQAVDALSAAHRRISDMLRETAPGAPARLSQDGLVAALRSLLNGDLAGEFQAVDWQIDPLTQKKARNLPLFSAEVIYFAARELIRNAARYGRGEGDLRRQALRLKISLEPDEGRLRLVVEDDGVGLQAGSSPVGAGSGLRLHSAMLAAIGARLSVSSSPAGGARGEISFDWNPAIDKSPA